VTRTPTHPAPLADKRATEYLANERTFLAWIRTAIAVISLGFVVAKFSLWLSELAAKLQSGAALPHSGASIPIGISMMALGGLLAVLAAWRYRVVNRAIERGVGLPGHVLGGGVRAVVGLMAVAMIGYMLLTAPQQ